MKTLLNPIALLFAIIKPVTFYAAINYTVGSEEASAFDDLPAGDYNVMITDSEMKETKDRMGQYLNLTLTIMGGNANGRKIFDRLNLVNKNPTASQIARQTLQSICDAQGRTKGGQLQDSAELHNIPMVIRLSYSEKTRSGETIPEGQRNEVKAYKKAESAQGFTAQPQAPAYAQPQQSYAPQTVSAAAPFAPQTAAVAQPAPFAPPPQPAQTNGAPVAAWDR